MSTGITTPKTNTQWPHSPRKEAPVCWDCAEKGHVDHGTGSPTWQSFKKIKKTFQFLDSASAPSSTTVVAGSPSSAPEVRPAEDGMEVGNPDPRKSQPGLEVVSGPRVVSPSDNSKFPFVGPKSWDSELDQKMVVVPGPRLICRLRRRTFWIALACALLAIVCTAVGVAVCLTQRHNSTHSMGLSMDSGGDQTVSSSLVSFPSITAKTISKYMTSKPPIPPSPSGKTPPTHPTAVPASNTDPNTLQPTPTPTSPRPTANPTVAPDSGSDECLGEDGRTYRDPDTGSEWKIECAVAHKGKDIENLEAGSMEECVRLCAKNAACRGAIYYDVGPQGTDFNYCWLKSAMQDDLTSTTDAQSVVRI